MMNRPGLKIKVLLLALLAQITALVAVAQTEDRKDKTTAVTFEELYDEPYAVNKLFIGFQPLYAEVFATNTTAGYGLDVTYYYRDKFDVHGNFRKAYSHTFYDLNRDLALKNTSPGVVDKPQIFNYFEIGGTYHFKDFEEDGTTKIVLYKKSYKGNLWAARVPLHAVVPCKVRKIYGGRLGAIIWDGTTDLSNILAKQKLTNADLKNAEGQSLPTTYTTSQGQVRQFDVFGNIYSTSIYAGGSIAWFRNVAVSFDKYDAAIDDGMLTMYFDIQYAPAVTLDPIRYTQGGALPENYSTNVVKKTPLGCRFGLDGKFNRQFSFGYGGEMGFRPSVQGRTFYALFKVSFPLYGTNLDYKVESFGK